VVEYMAGFLADDSLSCEDLEETLVPLIQVRLASVGHLRASRESDPPRTPPAWTRPKRKRCCGS
jgi:hypothetical protein